MSDDVWSVRGVDAEARQAAKMAAVGAGATLGAWLMNAIYKQCGRDKGGGGKKVAEAEGIDLGPGPSAAQIRKLAEGKRVDFADEATLMPADPELRFEVPAKFRNRYCKEHHMMPCDYCAKRAVEEGGAY